ncbi:MAG: ferrous iron transport protein A [Leptospiraceae bacterium]|nr:ferrous iron transport protein A [Leptospiraceae bacterium]MBK7058023.1 ferrous iron transport protein A [Leptospiraceae bacterium]MBK9501833.1 ferrous iron transport protein A [Leptospiraceae bacterium]MBP9163410.1 ferrous iron transport protein A [Leptospiraceae bacterium]
MKKSLSSLELKQTAQVDLINQDELRPEYIMELIDYGFLPGTEISVLQKYQSQNKIVVQIGRTKVSLRLNDAMYIQVSTNE